MYTGPISKREGLRRRTSFRRLFPVSLSRTVMGSKIHAHRSPVGKL